MADPMSYEEENEDVLPEKEKIQGYYNAVCMF